MMTSLFWASVLLVVLFILSFLGVQNKHMFRHSKGCEDEEKGGGASDPFQVATSEVTFALHKSPIRMARMVRMVSFTHKKGGLVSLQEPGVIIPQTTH